MTMSIASFPYFMLVALEGGGPLRALALLLLSPLLWLLGLVGLDDKAILLMIFVSTAGLRLADVNAVSKAILPRFYLSDLKGRADVPWVLVSSCRGGDTYAVVTTSIPRIMVEPFLREFLGVDYVVGTEMRMVGDYCSGLVAAPGGQSLEALVAALIGDILSKETHLIPAEEEKSRSVTLPRRDHPKPLIFHDGRLVAHPTPLVSLAILLWLPLGILLAISRILVAMLLPYSLGPLGCAASGFCIRAQFPPVSEAALSPKSMRRRRGTLYVCSHRTLLDPVIVSTALQRRVTAVTYSLSRFSELISPIPTVRLRRDRSKDGLAMRALLDGGDLVVCPEGTTCREPYLLRFSPLFAEIADEIVPVAVAVDGSMFYGTTVRGYKWMDSFFFLMNPRPCYELKFLDRLSTGDLEGSSSYDVANHIQQSIACALGFECTNLTRRDKYRMIAGNDGVDPRT